MKHKRIVNNFLCRDANLEYEITGFQPMEKGDMYCPSSPAETEFEVYFLDNNDERICEVPEAMLKYWNLEQEITEEQYRSRIQARAEAYYEDLKYAGRRAS